MKVKDITSALSLFGVKVSSKEDFYNGSGYRERYTIVGCDEVDGYTSYLGLPTKVKTQGFITKKGVLQNFYYHTGTGFVTTQDIDLFLKEILK